MTLFQTLGTPDPTQRIFRITVQDIHIKPSNFPTLGVTYANWAFDAKERLDDGWNAYVYIGPDEAPVGRSAFLFGPATAGTARTRTNIIESYPWPDVLTAIVAQPKYHVSGYVADYFWVPTLKTYNGPTKTVITEIWSAQPHTITVPATVMKPLPIDILYYQNEYHLHPTLHPSYGPVDLVTAGSIDHPTWGDTGNLGYTIPATTVIDWPSTVTISDRQEPEAGGWLRRSVIAYAPGT